MTKTKNNQPTTLQGKTKNNQPTTLQGKTKNNQPTTAPLAPLAPPAPRKKRAVVRKRKSEPDWGYENDVNAPVWKYTAFSESGAVSLAKTMKKLGCSIVEKPSQREDGLWIFSFTNPLLKVDRLRTVVNCGKLVDDFVEGFGN